jgi:hypothetical protein
MALLGPWSQVDFGYNLLNWFNLVRQQRRLITPREF